MLNEKALIKKWLCVVRPDRNPSSLAVTFTKKRFMCWQKPSLKALSAAITIKAHQPRNVLSGKLRAEKAANSDCVKCRDRDLSGGESCAAHYFKGNTAIRDDFVGKNSRFMSLVNPRSLISRGRIWEVLLYIIYENQKKNRTRTLMIVRK